MHFEFRRFLLVIALCTSVLAFGQNQRGTELPAEGGDFSNATDSPTKVPTGVILVKGAWSSASDAITPVPEGGSVKDNIFNDDYFRIHYPLPMGWIERYEGPPPSDTGQYVLAQIQPADRNGNRRGSVLMTAQDIFFTPQPAANVFDHMRLIKDTLQADYKLEAPISQTQIAGRTFAFLSYWSPVAQLHWYVMATQIRCHTVEIVVSSRDTKLIESLIAGLDKMSLPAEAGISAGTGGGDVPVCVKGYARGDNVLEKVDPVFSQPKFNAVPVRIIIDKKGKVKHVHLLSAFEDQSKAITDALMQWRFRPYLVDGHPVDVETGIMFGRIPRPPGSQAAGSAVE